MKTCQSCNMSFEDDINYCKHCGTELVSETNKGNYISKRSLIIIMVILSWEYLKILLWIPIQSIILPMYQREQGNWGLKWGEFVGTYNLTIDLLTISLLIFSLLSIKNKMVRIFILAFLFIRIISSLLFRFVF